MNKIGLFLFALFMLGLWSPAPAMACDPPVLAVRTFAPVYPAPVFVQRDVVAVDRGFSATQIQLGLFGRLRSFQQINGGGSATQLNLGPRGRLRSFQQIN